jgi:thiamine biosynthesis lipoprotein ApbE
MPLWLRKTTFNLLKEHYDKQNEEMEKQQNMLNNKKEISRPNIAPSSQPTYTAKVPKK